MTYAAVLHRLYHSPSPLTLVASPPPLSPPPPPTTTPRSRCSCSKGVEMAAVKAIRVHELGGPEVMRWEQVEVGEPKDGEIRIKNTAIGVNFIDVYFREGVYSAPLPFVPGMEAVGVVTAVGPGLTGRKVGDVVAYAGTPMGSYAQEQIIPASVAVPLPPSIDHNTAAAILLKGMTAHVLLRRVVKVQSGDWVLVHAAAGGVGSLLCQWANALGATVIGTVSNEEKAAQAAQDGCQHVIIYTKEDVVTRVKEFTAGKGVNVVYDSVGKDTYKASVECLATRGMLVSFGQSSGKPDPIPLSDLAAKSLFLTRPSMLHYTATREELLESAGEVFANVGSGVLRIRVNHTYPLSQAARAHADLQDRKTSGSILLIPDDS
ncbi:quinone oxidoreductase 1-like isoform X2 [Oryza brachyantha]|uniref:Probable quinone oxidoreductase n=1 Tax=Oryza brachyantha TaxID=4533 RepID=J3LIZ3_ORYBR|nr:quinone oxidoreductase 1-like isoform X2 [Oryza brachyantha]